MERIEIKKDGKLYKIEWIYDEEKHEGEYQDIDITEHAIKYLLDGPCTIADGITLRDIFLLLNTKIEMFDAVLGNWCKEIVEEGLNKESIRPEEYKDIGYLELYWHYELNDHWNIKKEGYDKESSLEGTLRPGFHGVSHSSEGITNWGLSYSPANELIDIPIKLSSKLDIYDSRSHDDKSLEERRIAWQNKMLSADHSYYTLGNVLDGIIYELSFHGGPEDRDKHCKELKELTESIIAGEEEMKPWEEIEKGNIK